MSRDRAAVEWWGTWVEQGQRVTLAGATLLRFDTDGQVVDHRDYWNEVERREAPYPGWLSRLSGRRGSTRSTRPPAAPSGG